MNTERLRHRVLMLEVSMNERNIISVPSVSLCGNYIITQRHGEHGIEIQDFNAGGEDEGL